MAGAKDDKKGLQYVKELNKIHHMIEFHAKGTMARQANPNFFLKVAVGAGYILLMG